MIDREKLARRTYDLHPIEDWNLEMLSWEDLSQALRDHKVKRIERLAAAIDAGDLEVG